MKNWTSLTLGVILLATLTTGCEVSKENSHTVSHECIDGSAIVGGAYVSSEQALSKKVVALLSTDGKEQSICTGTPISDDLILTAAHCVKGAVKIVALFSNDLGCGSGFKISTHGIEASSFTYDRRFTGTDGAIDNDYGLVRLKSAIPSNYKISRIYSGGALSSENVTLVGYGVTSERGEGSGFLRTKIKSKNDVSVKNGKVYLAQYEGGVCKGDSGGPLFVEVNGELEILGVTSYGTSYSDETVCHGKGIFAYAPGMVTWIQSVMPYLK